MAAPILELLNQIDWKEEEPPVTPTGLYVTHSGILVIAGIELEAMILSDGQRIFRKESIDKFFKALSG